MVRIPKGCKAKIFIWGIYQVKKQQKPGKEALILIPGYKKRKRGCKKPENETKTPFLPSLQYLKHLYGADPASKHLRFGQWFFNNYCLHTAAGGWPMLYYANNNKAEWIIHKWLLDNHYMYSIPITNELRERLRK